MQIINIICQGIFYFSEYCRKMKYIITHHLETVSQYVSDKIKTFPSLWKIFKYM